ncbi:tetratricopeptide repeat protein [Thermodesulfobacteriota bacterium]
MRRLTGLVLILLFVLFTHLAAHGQEENGRAYYDFGVFAYEDGDYQGAEKNLQRALKSNPDDPFYNHFLGKIYLKMERYDECIAYLSKAWKIDPSISGLRYDMAFLYYKMEDYPQASELFREVIEEDPKNVLAHYHGGVSLYKEKIYDKALDYFKKASDMSPTIKTNGYYYAGICHLKLGDFDDAVEKLEYVRDNAEKMALRQYAVKWLEAIERQKKALKPYSLYLKMSYEYDDNVRLEPIDLDIYGDEDDYVTVGYFSGRYNLSNKPDSKIGIGYSHYQTWHDDLDRYDLVGSIFELYYKHRIGPLTISLSYLPQYYWLDSESYLMKHQIKPEVTIKIREELISRFTYSYYRNNYMQDNDRDGHTNDLSASLYYSLKDKKGLVFGGIGIEDNTASHNDQRYETLKANIGLSMPVYKDFTLNITGKYHNKDYDHVNSSYLVKREDSKYNGSISLSHRFYYDWLNISGEFSYTKNDSNINDYEYKRKVTTLSLTARF